MRQREDEEIREKMMYPGFKDGAYEVIGFRDPVYCLLDKWDVLNDQICTKVSMLSLVILYEQLVPRAGKLTLRIGLAQYCTYGLRKLSIS